MGRPEFTANRTIQTNGVNAYQAGDGVHKDAVENLGLSIGPDGDVMPVEGTMLPLPSKNALRSEWETFALSRGMPAEEVDALTKPELVAAFTEDDEGEA